MILRFMQGDKAGKTVEIKGDNYTIGRETECDLFIDEDGISRLHCRITKESDDYFVQDTGSTNGVYVNGKKAEGRVKLGNNDKVRIGPQILLFTTDSNVLAADKLEKLDELKKQKEVVAPVVATEADSAADEKPPPPAPTPALPPKSEPKPKAKAPVSGMNLIMGFVIVTLVVALGYVALVDPDPGPKKKDKDDDQALVTDSDINSGINVSGAGTTDSEVIKPPDNGSGKTPPIEPPVEPPPPKIPFAELDKIPAFLFRSQPTGADVVIEGKTVGKTPVMVKDLKKGTNAVLLRRKGYRDLDTVFEVPTRGEVTPFKLKQNVGSFLITSDPAGATVMFGDQVLGETPWMVTNPEWVGKELTIKAVGYQPWNAVVELSTLRATHIKAQLSPLGGDLRIYTLPAGAEIYVDGLAKVRARRAAKGESPPVVLESIRPGRHKVYIQLADGTKSEEVEVVVATGQMKTVRPTIYTPNTMVVTKDKKIYEGMYCTKTGKGDIVLAISNKKHKVFKKADITEMKPLEE